MGSTKAAMKEAGQDTKEYNRTLEKQKLTKNETSKAGFVLDMSHFH
jgi:hypothetical protein